MQNLAPICTVLLVRTSGWLLGAIVLPLRGKIAYQIFLNVLAIKRTACEAYFLVNIACFRKYLEGTRITLVKL